MDIRLQFQAIAKRVGMSCCLDQRGEDAEIIRLAETVGMTRRDIAMRPSAVADEITAYLDSLVRNP